MFLIINVISMTIKCNFYNNYNIHSSAENHCFLLIVIFMNRKPWYTCLVICLQSQEVVLKS